MWYRCVCIDVPLCNGWMRSQLVTAVSGKTSYLIAGSVLEDGRPVNDGSKYKGAVDKNVKL